MSLTTKTPAERWPLSAYKLLLERVADRGFEGAVVAKIGIAAWDAEEARSAHLAGGVGRPVDASTRCSTDGVGHLEPTLQLVKQSLEPRNKMMDDNTQGGILRSERGSIGSGSVDGTMRHPISASMGPMPGQSKRGLTTRP